MPAPAAPMVARRAVSRMSGFAHLLQCTLLLVLLCLATAPLTAANAFSYRPEALTRGTQTGLPLPRFARIKASAANLRRGPGFRYPIIWQYRRRYLPVIIVREFGNWRLLRFSDGTRGWMHRALLTGGRSFVVTARRTALRRAPRARAAVVAWLGHGVIGVLRRCRSAVGWCRVKCHHMSGFVRQHAIWGTDRNLRSVR